MLPLQRKVKTFPDKPGVYIFKEKSGKVIYVGKAKSLKKRASSYFKPSPDTKVSLIISRAHSIEYIITSNELEALLLESNLIKKHKPRYNVLLRDDKQYPYVKITLNEEWPRVLIVRKIEDDGAAYYGPYVGRTARDIIKMFKRLLQLVWCKKFKMRKEPCFYYHLDKCLAPCIGDISKKEYMNIVNEAIDFLDGKVEVTIDKLKKEMQIASEAQQYERAAALRNKIRAFERVLESQEVLTAKKEDKDVASLTMLESKALFLVLQIRGGKLIGRESYFIGNSKGENEVSLLFSTIIQYYTSLPKIPPEIVVKPGFKDISTLRKILTRLKRGSVKLVSP
ncbi:excinuclease ABC subunit UvrC, partial [Candidatus Margulisiibacteriota bacterium]